MVRSERIVWIWLHLAVFALCFEFGWWAQGVWG